MIKFILTSQYGILNTIVADQAKRFGAFSADGFSFIRICQAVFNSFLANPVLKIEV